MLVCKVLIFKVVEADSKYMADSTIYKIKEKVGSIIDSGAHINIAKTTQEIGKIFGLNERMRNYTHIEIRNKLNEFTYKTVPYNKRILFLPHCLKVAGVCKAPLTDEGLNLDFCDKCEAADQCQINEIKKIAEEMKYMKIAVAPGGSMVHKIIAKYKPKAVLGVCCYNEAIMAFEKIKGKNMGAQAVLLMRDGCKDTAVNVDEVKEKLELCKNE
ncbi:MAG: DUF116 domain-containing protein [Candidatus Diapherotrites archaeon]